MNLRKMKFTSKFVSIILILGLVFSMNSFAFAEDSTTPKATDVSSDAIESTADFPVAEEQPAAIPLKSGGDMTAKRAPGDNGLEIKSVEVLNKGEFQNKYRDTVYKGVAADGEDINKWYTTYREINLKDPRVFNLEYTVSAASVSAISTTSPALYLDAVELYYGGHPIGDWGNGNDLRGSTDIFTVDDSTKSINDNGDGTYTIKLSMETASPWASYKQNTDSNIPFDGYFAGSQGNFGTGQRNDNRAWWQAGPAQKGMGTYELSAVAVKTNPANQNKTVLKQAATDVHVGPYDEMNSWIEMNEWAQSIVKAITGSEIAIKELNRKPTGTVAKGYVGVDSEGNFVKGNSTSNVWVEVAITGYGLTDNYKTENKGFNNYSRFNPMWNIVVAKDAGTVDTYLNETVPTMNEDPQKLIDKYKNEAPEDIDMVNVFYQNNVHADEVTGTDNEIKLINDLIEGGKSGKTISYKTYEDSDMNYRYRVPTAGFETSKNSHIVKDGYDGAGRFNDPNTRTDKTFDTGDALKQLIFVTTLTSNPDGKAGMRRVNRYGIDNNRDSNYATQPETIALTKDVCKWDPLVMNEWHGYVGAMLIEPCTAPHDPSFDYDLLQNNMLKLSYTAGKAVTASTGYANFRVPWDQLGNGAWDDGGTVYTPMLAMLLGTYGYTIELPHSNADSFDAGNVINYAMINELMDGETQFYPGNALNGALKDDKGVTRDSHSVDNKYPSMRKSSVMNKLETKLRGVENTDSMAADKYFIDVKGGSEVVVGRPRPVDSNGDTLSYFPDYIVIPTDDANQYNLTEGIKGINWMMKLGVKVSVATEDVAYGGKIIPKGAYVLDMKQGMRNLIYEFMSKGYDATNFSGMYADIYCNFPDLRGYDSIQVYNDGLYDNKLKEVTSQIGKKANIAGETSDYVTFKSQSTDAVRFVNLLLSGKSSGGSSAAKGDVWMLKKDAAGVGKASDYIIKTKDLSKIKSLKDDANLGLHGCQIEGKYISDLPDEAVKLVEPKIHFNTTRTEQTGGPLWWVLDDYLGFGSMADYNGSGNTTLRDGANVVLSDNQAPGGHIIKAIRDKKLGMILIQNASAINDDNFGVETDSPKATAFADVALNGTYNVDDSLYSTNYAKTTTMYARGNGFTNIPKGSKVLFKSLTNGDDAFIGGFQAVNGDKSRFGDSTTIFSTILNGDEVKGKPVQALVIGQNMSYRAHYQKLLPMLATGIYAGAAGILDDQNTPSIDQMEVNDSMFKITASEPDSGYVESGIETLAVYHKKGEKFVQLCDANVNEFEFKADAAKDQQFKVIATDYAGNAVAKYIIYTAKDGRFAYSDTTIDPPGANEFTIATTAGEGGTITASGNFKAGSSATFTYKPNKGYKVSKLYVDDNLVASEEKGGTYSFKNIRDNHTISVLFEKDDSVLGESAKPTKAAPKNFKVKAQKKKAKLTWKKSSGVTKYQVAYKQKGKKKWSYKTISSKKKAVTIKKLKANKKYQFKIRSYKTTNGKKVYSKWSKTKTVKIKS